MPRGPVNHATRTTDGLIGTTEGTFRVFHGFQITAGAAAEVEIRDGSATGTLLAKARLAAAGEQPPTPLWIDRGIATAGGVWVEIVSGTPTVIVYGV